MMAPQDASRRRDQRDERVPAPIRPEPLRDEVFAACGYAFTIAAVVASLLTSRIGTLALIFGAVLAALLVPVNVLAIRRYARVRRLLRAHTERRASAATRDDASQR